MLPDISGLSAFCQKMILTLCAKHLASGDFKNETDFFICWCAIEDLWARARRVKDKELTYELTGFLVKHEVYTPITNEEYRSMVDYSGRRNGFVLYNDIWHVFNDWPHNKGLTVYDERDY